MFGLNRSKVGFFVWFMQIQGSIILFMQIQGSVVLFYINSGLSRVQ